MGSSGGLADFVLEPGSTIQLAQPSVVRCEWIVISMLGGFAGFTHLSLAWHCDSIPFKSALGFAFISMMKLKRKRFYGMRRTFEFCTPDKRTLCGTQWSRYKHCIYQFTALHRFATLVREEKELLSKDYAS